MSASYSGLGGGGRLPLPNIVDGLFSSITPHVAAAAIPPSARSTKISSGVPIGVILSNYRSSRRSDFYPKAQIHKWLSKKCRSLSKYSRLHQPELGSTPMPMTRRRHFGQLSQLRKLSRARKACQRCLMASFLLAS